MASRRSYVNRGCPRRCSGSAGRRSPRESAVLSSRTVQRANHSAREHLITQISQYANFSTRHRLSATVAQHRHSPPITQLSSRITTLHRTPIQHAFRRESGTRFLHDAIECIHWSRIFAQHRRGAVESVHSRIGAIGARAVSRGNRVVFAGVRVVDPHAWLVRLGDQHSLVCGCSALEAMSRA